MIPKHMYSGEMELRALYRNLRSFRARLAPDLFEQFQTDSDM